MRSQRNLVGFIIQQSIVELDIAFQFLDRFSHVSVVYVRIVSGLPVLIVFQLDNRLKCGIAKYIGSHSKLGLDSVSDDALFKMAVLWEKPITITIVKTDHDTSVWSLILIS